MKYIWVLLIAITFLGSCKKEEDKTGTVLFYLDSGNATENWHLIVDDVDRGQLMPALQMPVCEDPDFIRLTLAVGEHKIRWKSMNGFASPNNTSFSVAEGCTQRKVNP